MIQLYNPTNTDYTRNGDMTLMPTSAQVHVILNGAWEASLEHPIDAEGRWKYIAEDAVVKMPSFNGEQLFRIKQTEKKDSGVSAVLEPIFYDSMDDCFLTDIRPTNKNGQEALDLMTAPNSKYSGKSNISKASTAYYEYKNLMEAINGDDDNSFINRWGGEILFDNFNVIINDRAGGDYGVELRYGKNIPQDGLTETVDTREVVTRIYPKAYNGHKLSGGGYVDSSLINSYPTIRTATQTFEDVKLAEDASEDDAENGVIICANQTALDKALTDKCKEQFELGLDKPKVSISADMVLLSDTEDYKDYKVLETVSLGDTIHCRHNRLGIVTDARVIELTYDALSKKVTDVVLGDFQRDYFSDVSSAVTRIDSAIRPDGTVMADKIAGFINGAVTRLGAQYNAAKKQDVLAILFENLDETSPMFGALAIGTQGILISRQRTSDGRSWEWTLAIDYNGIIADTIVAGVLSDKQGKNYWDLDTGEFKITNGIIDITTNSSSFSVLTLRYHSEILGWDEEVEIAPYAVKASVTKNSGKWETILGMDGISLTKTTDDGYKVLFNVDEDGNVNAEGKLCSQGYAARTVVDSGDLANWHYIKYSDGTAECWGITSRTVNCNTQWGNWYYDSGNYIYDFYPIDFIEPPVCNYSINSYGAGASSVVEMTRGAEATVKETVHIMVARPTPASGITVEAHWSVKGRWK